MENTVRVLDDLVESGVIERYAIGGAVGALFYVETFHTEYLDVFCLVPTPVSALMPFAEVNAALQQRGYRFDDELISIEGVPVQFLPASGSPLVDALADAIEMPHGKTATRVMRPEHLAAIALQTGRDKDYLRVDLLMRQAKDFDTGLFKNLVVLHALSMRLHTFENRFPEAAKLLR